MDVHSFNKKLSKIAALVDDASTDGVVSSLERDLLLSYIRELYDIALDGKSVHPKPIAREVSAPEKQAEKVITPPKPIIERPAQIPVVEPVAETPTAAPVVTPLVVESPKPVEKAAPAPVKIPETVDMAAILAEIFADEKVTDLSDKLSQTHIIDLTKSMGINEKIFTQQELFANDQNAFNDTLVKLNSFNNFEDAKQYLTDHVISKFAWTSEGKIKKAATFVRLIKRKYS